MDTARRVGGGGGQPACVQQIVNKHALRFAIMPNYLPVIRSMSTNDLNNDPP